MLTQMTRSWKILLITLVFVAAILVAGMKVFSKRKPHSVTLSWVASSRKPGNTIAGYNIYRRDTSGASGEDYARIASDVPCCTYSDHQVSSGHTYDYAVSAVDSQGKESSWSSLTTARIP